MSSEWYETSRAFYAKYRELGGMDAELVCVRCGCRVEDSDIHDAWHAELGK